MGRGHHRGMDGTSGGRCNIAFIEKWHKICLITFGSRRPVRRAPYWLATCHPYVNIDTKIGKSEFFIPTGPF